MVNRYSTTQAYQGNLYTPPVDLAEHVMDAYQQKYETNQAKADTLVNNYINALPQDRLAANQIQQGYEDQINGIVKKYNGDYAAASGDLSKLLYQVKKDYNPGGKAHAISTNYSNYQQWLKDQQEMVKKGEVLGEDFNIANQYHMKNYSGIGELDPSTGTYNTFSPETLTKYVNPTKLIEDANKNIKAQHYKNTRTVFSGDGRQHDITTEYEGVTPDRLSSVFYNSLATNPEYTQYLKQRSKYLGVPASQADAYMKAHANQSAQDLSYMNDLSGEKVSTDPLYLERMRENHADRAAAKLAAQKQQDMSSFMGAFTYEPTTELADRKKTNLDPNDWKSTVEGGGYKFAGYPGSIGMPITYNVGKGSTYAAEWKDKNLVTASKDPDFLKSNNLIPGLFNFLIDRNKAASKDFATRYGKDTSYTDEFDKQVLKDYKANEADHSRGVVRSIPIGSKAGREEMTRHVAGMLTDPSSVTVYQVGNENAQKASDFELTSEDLLNKNNVRTDIMESARYGVPSMGIASAGYMLTIPKKGTFVFKDQDTNRSTLSDELASAFNGINFRGDTKGGTIRIQQGDATHAPVYARPEVAYSSAANGKVKEHTNYRMMVPDASGNLKPSDVVTDKISEEQIMSQYLPGFKGFAGNGADAKKENAAFQFLMSQYH